MVMCVREKEEEEEWSFGQLTAQRTWGKRTRERLINCDTESHNIHAACLMINPIR